MSDLQKLTKTAILSSDFTGTYSLALDQGPGFWTQVLDRAPVLRALPTDFVDANYVYSSELTMSEDILRPGVSGTDPGDTVTVGDDVRTFRPEELIAIASISDGVLEDNLEGDALMDRILGMVAAASANSIQDAVFFGKISGTTNSQRGSIPGCFDGFLEQARDDGTVIDATDYSDRLVDLDGSSNDKHIDAVGQDCVDKYAQDWVWLSSRSIMSSAWGVLGPGRATNLGDRYTELGLRGFDNLYGYPVIGVPGWRTNLLVKGTGTLSGDDQINGNGVAKARSTSITVDDTTGFVDTDTFVAGALDSAGADFEINAEKCTVSGTPTATVITTATALSYDHADNEYIVEYSSAPTANGIWQLFTSLSNCRLKVQRDMTIEFQRQARTRCTEVIVTMRLVPVLDNPNASVLIRGLQAA